MILTKENIEAGSTSGVSYTRRQLEALGVAWPPVHGWKAGLIGKTISDEKYAEFMRMSGVKGGTKRASQILRDRETPTLL